MRLKKLEITGFKSFRDKISLDFPEGINAIVGANGSGKSNIVDAIRWAMGEQRVKSLRGKKMEDIIFNGTDTSAGVGMAEVALILDNTNGGLPVPYSDFEEISVARKLFRDGESEYYINNVPCRLLDVKEFFMGTGLGGRAYSIIEQNSISSMVEAKPEEIRQFIEEAAGISKYRSRKESAMRKLEAADQNIVRVKDIIKEVKNQLNSLARQAKRAESFKATREQMKEAQLSLALQKHMELGDRREEITQKSQGLNDSITTINASKEALDAQLVAIKVETMETGETLSACQQRFYELKNQINIKEQKLVFNLNKTGELTKRKKLYGEELESLNGKIKEFQNTLSSTMTKIGTLEESVASDIKESEVLAEIVVSLTRQEEEIYRTIEHTKANYMDIVTAKTNHRNAIASVSKQLEDLSKKVANNEQEMSNMKERLAILTDMVLVAKESIGSSFRDKEEVNARSVIVAEEKQRLINDITETDENISTLRTQISQKSSRLESLQEFQAGYSWCPTGAQVLLASTSTNTPDHLRAGILGTVAESIEVERGFENAVDAVLGVHMHLVIVASAEMGISAIDYIRSSGLERSSFVALPLCKVRAQDSVISTNNQNAIALADKVKAQGELATMVTYLLRDSFIVDSIACLLYTSPSPRDS